MTVPIRFNRMILFRPWFWHTAGASFGDNIENGRLVHLSLLARGFPAGVTPRYSTVR